MISRLILLSSVLLLTAATTAHAGWTPLPPVTALTAVQLTPGEGTGRYAAQLAGGALTVSAAGQVGNQRELLWPTGQVPMRDAQVCATWTSGPGPAAQEGLAVRITNEPGRVRAVTITKNVWAGIWWVFNVHTWDTTQDPPFQLVAQLDLGALLTSWGTMVPLPWRVCIKAADQAVLFKLWLPDREAEPGWDDRAHGGVAVLPADYVTVGHAGWHAGHLPQGSSVTYHNLGVWEYGP